MINTDIQTKRTFKVFVLPQYFDVNDVKELTVKVPAHEIEGMSARELTKLFNEQVGQYYTATKKSSTIFWEEEK